jgi:hypothetical protein
MISKMNKRGHMYAIGLVLATIVICGTMLYSLVQASTSIKVSISSSPLQDVYSQQAKFDIYIKDSANLAAQQALFETARKGAVSGPDCKAYDNNPSYVIWNDKCNPVVLDTDALFGQYLSSSFENFIKTYPDSLNQSKFSVVVESYSSAINRVKIDSGDLVLIKPAEKGIIGYTAEYSFNPSFVYDFEMGPQDFRNVYTLINLKLAECKKANPKAAFIAPCMNSLQIAGKWSNLAIKDSMDGRDYVLFRMLSVKKFFYQDSFDSKFKWERVELKFAIEI